VNDLGTADFMHFFYRHMAGGESAGVALRRAKLEMIRSNRLGYRDPYFWAPFVLQGLE
jgi:CHAT domain-containing protein